MENLYGIQISGGEYDDSWWEQLCVVSTQTEAENLCNEANKVVFECKSARKAWYESHKHLHNWNPVPHALHERFVKKMKATGKEAELKQMEAENLAVLQANSVWSDACDAAEEVNTKPFLEKIKVLFPWVEDPTTMLDVLYSYAELPWLSEVKIPQK